MLKCIYLLCEQSKVKALGFVCNIRECVWSQLLNRHNVNSIDACFENNYEINTFVRFQFEAISVHSMVFTPTTKYCGPLQDV